MDQGRVALLPDHRADLRNNNAAHFSLLLLALEGALYRIMSLKVSLGLLPLPGVGDGACI
jgi:hypothetical protein